MDEPLPLLKHITRDLFANRGESEKVTTANVDSFLYENFPFVQLPTLSKELVSLSSDLDDSLLDLVNDNFTAFIKVGELFYSNDEDSLPLMVQELKVQLKQYVEKLTTAKEAISKDQDKLDELLKEKEQVTQLRNKVVQMIFVEQVVQVVSQLLDNIHTDTRAETLQESYKLLRRARSMPTSTKFHNVWSKFEQVLQSTTDDVLKNGGEDELIAVLKGIYGDL